MPNKSNVPVPLHNRFQVLNNFDAEREVSVQRGIMQRDSNVKSTDTSMVVAGGKCLEQHSQECKHPLLLGVLQPFTAVQQNSSFSGNKNKTGSFGIGNICTKYSSDDSLSQDSSDSPCEKNSGLIVPSVNNCDRNTVVAISSQDVGIESQPQLADLKNYFSGNKNKTGSSDGVSCANTREIFDNYVENDEFEHCGDDFNVIDTAISDLELHQNCSHNNTDHTGQFSHNTGVC